VTIKQTVDQVQIARPAASGADGEFSREMRLSARSKCGNLLVPDVKPLDFAVSADGIRQTVLGCRRQCRRCD
jgi:hypothetical protein